MVYLFLYQAMERKEQISLIGDSLYMMEKSSYAPIVLAAASAPPPLLPFVGPYVLVNAKLSISDDGCCWIYMYLYHSIYIRTVRS